MIQADYNKKFNKDLSYFMRYEPENASVLFGLVDYILKSKPLTLEGPGNPEFLKGNWSGYMSRSITSKHRLVYRYKSKKVYFIQARGHYSDK
ncbi:MAG: type II toxin-antitoxin system YoeB family toxin [Bacteroidota bacterium]